MTNGSPAAGSPNEPAIAFDWVFIRELAFKDVASDPATSGPLPGLLTDLEADLEIRSWIDDTKTVCRIYARLAFREREGQPAQPSIMAAVEGQFRVIGDASSANLSEFAEHQGPAILYPFLRDAIATATGKTRLGQLLLAPINLAGVKAEPAVTQSVAADKSLQR